MPKFGVAHIIFPINLDSMKVMIVTQKFGASGVILMYVQTTHYRDPSLTKSLHGLPQCFGIFLSIESRIRLHCTTFGNLQEHDIIVK